MTKLLKPVKQLRQSYSLLINRGRDLISRPVTRGQDYTHLVEEIEKWDRDCALLVQSTFAAGGGPAYRHLPPASSSGDMKRDLHALHEEISAGIRQLQEIEHSLPETKRGCLGIF